MRKASPGQVLGQGAQRLGRHDRSGDHVEQHPGGGGGGHVGEVRRGPVAGGRAPREQGNVRLETYHQGQSAFHVGRS